MNSPKPTWRFLDTGAGNGPFNMAADEVLARNSSAQLPTLRLYKWNPFTVSLGFHQDWREIDADKCRRQGVEIVRRPSGGKAIYHAEEITYSVIIPSTSELYACRVTALYKKISSALLQGLHHFDKGLTLARRKRNKSEDEKEEIEAVCFTTGAQYEIQYASKKVVGSAQRRFDHSILQHGSIMLGNEHLNIVSFLPGTSNMDGQRFRNYLNNHTISIENILKRKVTYDEIVPVLKRGFEQVFQTDLSGDSLSEEETARIHALGKKYQNYGGYHHA